MDLIHIKNRQLIELSFEKLYKLYRENKIIGYDEKFMEMALKITYDESLRDEPLEQFMHTLNDTPDSSMYEKHISLLKLNRGELMHQEATGDYAEYYIEKAHIILTSNESIDWRRLEYLRAVTLHENEQRTCCN